MQCNAMQWKSFIMICYSMHCNERRLVEDFEQHWSKSVLLIGTTKLVRPPNSQTPNPKLSFPQPSPEPRAVAIRQVHLSFGPDQLLHDLFMSSESCQNECRVAFLGSFWVHEDGAQDVDFTRLLQDLRRIKHFSLLYYF